MRGHWDQAWAAFTRAAESINPEGPKAEDEAPKRVEKNPKVKLDAPVAAPADLPVRPVSRFTRCRSIYIWVDWIKGRPGYRFGPNRVPSGDFEDPDGHDRGRLGRRQLSDGRHQSPRSKTVSREEANGKAIAKNQTQPRPAQPRQRITRTEWSSFRSSPRTQEELDTILPKFFDFPVAAIRSPPIPVEANNLIRISVLVKRPYPSAGGLGGIIVRDSIGGEQFQFRTSGPIPSFSRVVLFRKAPADGTFTVMLGLAVQTDDGR